jgi:DNA-directed RNA polymerase specialized sigma24 family protein
MTTTPAVKKYSRPKGEAAARLRRYIVLRYIGGYSIRAIAADTGRSYGAVHATLTAAGIPLRKRGGRAAKH